MLAPNPIIGLGSSVLLWVAHNIERIADRATNLCERAIFISTGQLADLDV